MKVLLIIITFFCLSSTYGQTKYLLKNPKVGKCYKQNFQYDKKFEWTEVSCDSIKAKIVICEDSEKCLEEKEKLKAYQEELISLGYSLEITGCVDDQTIEAHHKYLKLKKKKERKNRRIKRRSNKI